MAAIEPGSGMSILDHCATETDEISLERYGAAVIVAWTGYQAKLLVGVNARIAEEAYAAGLRAACHKYRAIVGPLIADEESTG